MKTPKAVLDYCREFDETEKEAKEYILEQIKFFSSLPATSGNSAWWIAHKIGCTLSQGAAAIKWATGDTENHGNAS